MDTRVLVLYGCVALVWVWVIPRCWKQAKDMDRREKIKERAMRHHDKQLGTQRY